MKDNLENEPKVLAAISQGRVVEAIKLLRKSRGIGLKEAKTLVDDYRQANGLSEPSSGLSSESSKESSGSLSLWVFLVALAVVGYYAVHNYL